jgi:hypothetical protein
MRRLVRSLQKKPRATRNRIAFTSAGVIAGVVLLVWLYHIPSRLAEMAIDTGDVPDNQQAGLFEQISELESPFSNVTDEKGPAEAGQPGQRESVDQNTGWRDRYESVAPASTTMATSASSVQATSTTPTPATTTQASGTRPQPATTSSSEPRTVRIITTSAATSSERSAE